MKRSDQNSSGGVNPRLVHPSSSSSSPRAGQSPHQDSLTSMLVASREQAAQRLTSEHDRHRVLLSANVVPSSLFLETAAGREGWASAADAEQPTGMLPLLFPSRGSAATLSSQESRILLAGVLEDAVRICEDDHPIIASRRGHHQTDQVGRFLQQ